MNRPLLVTSLAAFVLFGSITVTVAQTSTPPPEQTLPPFAMPAPGTGLFNLVGPLQGNTTSSGVDITGTTPGFTMFAQVVKAVGLWDTLRGSGPFTIFAPTDDAFARIRQADLTALLDKHNYSRLREVALFWVVPQDVKTSDVNAWQSFKTLQGSSLFVKRTASGTYSANSANIIERDVQAWNGHIQVVDSVLVPRSTMRDDPRTPVF